MNAIEQARFNPLYQQMQQALLLQGMRPKTIDAYSRGVRRVADYVDRCPDNLTADELKSYFASLVASHSWSTVKLDRNGIQFFYRHVPGRPWDWVMIVKPPEVRSLPDVLTREETLDAINITHKLRYRVFFLTLYSMGLRLNDGLQLKVGDDIDGSRHHVHIRCAKGGKDRYVPLPEVTLDVLAGLPVGSGKIESANRSLMQARLKIPGAWWKIKNVDKMLALRVSRANGNWEKYWDSLKPDSQVSASMN